MSSGATTTISAVTPCRTAFRRDRRLPASAFGPVLLSALFRLTPICRNEVIGFSGRREFCRRSFQHQCLDQEVVPAEPSWDASVGFADPSSVPPLIGMAAPLTRVCCHNLSV